MSKLKTVPLLLVVAAIGYFARPWIEPYIPGLTTKEPIPELGKIYEPTVKLANSIRNPVIVVPGMMGSRLVQTSENRTVWGVFDSRSIDPDVAADVRLIACPIDGTDLDKFDDGVNATGVLDSMEIDFAGLSIDLGAYLNILRTLGVGGYRDEELGLAGAIDYGDEHYTCFQFPYDWRRDNAENARKLNEFLLKKKAYVEAQWKRKYGIDQTAKFDIVAHSMGGLLTRYFLRYGDQGPVSGDDGTTLDLNWAGCEHVDRVILIAPPNNGSAKSLTSAHEGFKFSPLVKSFPSGLVASLPSIYQLFPDGPEPAVFDKETGKPLDHFDIETWDRRGWGLLNPNQDSVLQQLLPDASSAEERRRIAKAHVQECLSRAVSFKQALDVPAAPPEGTTLFLFAGDAIATVDTIESNLKERTLEPRSKSPGDSTITRKSALGDQRTSDNWRPAVDSPVVFHDVCFLFDDHFGLTRDVKFTDNALYLLLEDPTKNSPSRLVVPIKK